MPANFVLKAVVFAAAMAMNMSRKIEGPRLDDLKFSGGDAGAPWPNIFGTRRTFGVPIWGLDLEEVPQTRKTKGGKFNNHTYYERSAYGFAGHETDALSRVWADKHLVLDLTGVGPVTPYQFTSSGGGGKGGGAAGAWLDSDYFTIYTGQIGQEPDPYMQGFVEAELGEGWCPAYKGRSFIVIKRLPVEKFGNRRPQYEFEVVRNKADNFPTQNVSIGTVPWTLRFNTDHTLLMAMNATEFSLVDVAARAEIVNPATDITTYDNAGYGIWNDGTTIGTNSPSHNEVRAFDETGGSTVLYSSGGPQGAVWAGTDDDGNNHYAQNPGTVGFPFIIDGEAYDPDDETGASWTAQGYFIDRDNSVWAIGQDGTHAHFWRLGDGAGPGYLTVLGVGSGGYGGMQAHHYRSGVYDQFVFTIDGDLYAADRVTGAILASNTSVPSGFLGGLDNLIPAAQTVWSRFTELSLADCSVVRSLNAADWGSSAGPSIYDPIGHALITQPSGGVLRWHALDRISGEGMTLGAIMNILAVGVGVVTYDFSTLTQVVPGYSATQGAASGSAEPLLDTFDSDIRPHNFGLQGVVRTGTSTVTITTPKFARAGDEPRYNLKRIAPSNFPLQLVYNFADLDKDQQPNNVASPRSGEATGAKGERSIDLSTLALDKDTARNLADRHFRRIINERVSLTNSLTAQYLALEPGDVATLNLDGEVDKYRLVRVTVRADDVLNCEWKYDHARLAVLKDGTGAEMVGIKENAIVIPLISKGFALDIPYLSDSENAVNPLIHFAAAPYADGAWPGATMFQAVDGEYSEELESIGSGERATWGYLSDNLPYANPNLWDRGSQVEVRIQTGALVGCTEADIDADPLRNLCAIGVNGRWELVNFTVATETAPKVYDVSGFKRGRRGTEWAAELHGDRDQFVLLDTAVTSEMGLSEVSTDLSFKALTSGRSTAPFPIPVAPFTGASLKPYAPCHLIAVKDPVTGDWTFTWVRRTRVGGAWTGGGPIPLSENSEEYSLTVGDGVTSDTKTVTSATTYLWTVAEQITDTSAEVMEGDLDWTIAQVSDAVGDGYLAEATA